MKFYHAKKIKCLMIEGAAINLECKAIESQQVGDHLVVTGEVLDVKIGERTP